jgi:hypothetical protein
MTKPSNPTGDSLVLGGCRPIFVLKEEHSENTGEQSYLHQLLAWVAGIYDICCRSTPSIFGPHCCQGKQREDDQNGWDPSGNNNSSDRTCRQVG